MRRRIYRQNYRRKIDDIERRRVEAGIMHRDLCARAGMGVTTWHEMRRDGMAFKRQIGALTMALRTLYRERKTILEQYPGAGVWSPQHRSARTAYLSISSAVRLAGVAETQIKSLALYLLVTGCNVPGAVAAAAAGCTKQNVSKQIRKIEDRRDDGDFDRTVSQLEMSLLHLEAY